ncbi:MAG: hypothetical protein PHZ09_08415 [Eubacteriales bacterium]|jgi:hypothetical protein|nr:hypothetical protein [Eubacteriales bacterium]
MQNESSIETLDSGIRDLWVNHVLWIGAYINALALGMNGLSYYNQRLYDNIDGIFNLFNKYYGYTTAKAFSTLLENHMLNQIKFFVDFKSGNLNTANMDREALQHNADETAKLLASINPRWDEAVWRDLLYEHLRLTEDELIYKIANNNPSPELISRAENQVILIAEYMAQGIKSQFYM